MPTNYTAKAGETLCEIGIKNGFADCTKLRAAKDSQKDIVTLADGQVVVVPDREKNNFDKALELVHVFQRPHFPPPNIWFIRDDGNAAKKPPQPDADTILTTLAFTNYPEDRGSDGSAKGDFPGPEQQLFDAKGSKDPDHFKIQVYDKDAASDNITVDLVPMRPDYYALVKDGATYVALHPTKRTPHDANKITVTCKRIPGTFYFRSPYMRLAPTKAGHARRVQQNLLVSGFWNDGGGDYIRRYGEQLHHTVRATYTLSGCPVKKCAAVVTASIDASRSIHMAYWALNTTAATADKIRETVYTWTRAVLAPANVRPIIEAIKIVPPPANMLAIANDGTFPPGRHASGKRNPTTASAMTFKIDGVALTYNPANGDSPATTANGIIAVVAGEKKLAGYTTKLFALPPRNPSAAGAANPVSDSVDILFFKPDGSAATVSAAASTDYPDASGNFGQSLVAVTLSSNFPVGWPDASPEQRIIRHNFHRSNCINFYIVGSVLTQPPGSATYDGWSPLGYFQGAYVDVGPCVYLTGGTGVTRPFVMFHEICHPLMHGFHAQQPFKDAYIGGAGLPGGLTPTTTELMDGAILNDTDAHDATRHLADAPITAKYQLAEEGGVSTLVNGSHVAPFSGVAWTPVKRLYTVGTTYGIIRYGDLPLLDSDIKDLPHGP